MLRRLGGERSRPRTLTVGEAGELSGSFHAGYPQLVLVARAGGWAVAVEDNGWEGSRPEVLRALSRGTRAVSVYRNVNALGYFSDAVDGELLVRFELLSPQRRWGSQPDLLLPQMRAVGLDPDWDEPPHGEVDTAALALAERHATRSGWPSSTTTRWSSRRWRPPRPGRPARSTTTRRWAGASAADAITSSIPGLT